MPPKVIPVESLQLSPTAARFQGERDGDGIGVSMFVTRYENGQGPAQHVHPYQEAFVVHRGTATFLVDGEETEVSAPSFVVVPAETPHGFKNRGTEPLEVISAHPSGMVLQTDL